MNNKYVIIADATCDLDENFQKQYDIVVLPSHVIMPNGEDVLSMPNWEYHTKEDFYSNLKKNPDSYATSPTNVQEFQEAFEKYAKDGYDILCLTISSGISGAFNFANIAKNNVISKYPESKISCIDSKRFGPGFGLLAIYASIQRSKGKSLEENTKYIEENKNKFHQAGWLDDLSFVAKKGRITHSKAFFGQLVGIKPIGEFDYNGLTTVLTKVKGAKKAYDLLLNYMEKTIINPSEQIIFIAQTNRYEQAKIFKDMIIEKFHPKEIYINDVYTCCGINVGPGLMAAYYMGTPISKDLEFERKIINEYLENGDIQ